jgi:hypothetical protein
MDPRTSNLTADVVRKVLLTANFGPMGSSLTRHRVSRLGTLPARAGIATAMELSPAGVRNIVVQTVAPGV